ncbi:unnamed protein product [Phyllotreta striolata]|uniref:Uncharacterized protein n=1 Tax=Phyllotreta striolata TaxID=444603 RepID=A0A9N9TMR0_PHYSR|nr:unnamed protein product [Phyllotreta striolata]
MSLLRSQFRNSIAKICKRYQQTQAKVCAPPSAPSGPVFLNHTCFPDRVAIRDKIARYTYANIFLSANELSKEITKICNGRTNERVAFMCSNDVNYVISLWAIWLSGQIAVPLSSLHPKNALLYYANDCQSKLLLSSPEYVELMKSVSTNTGTTLHVLDDKLSLNCAQKNYNTQADLEGGLPLNFYNDSNALILYTSGTTGSPKGVVVSHKNLQYSITTLLDAWKWSPNDVILHTLPLHHVHGTVNALLCPLYVGAKVIMLKKFNANTVWSFLLGVGANPEDRKTTIYMGVPTIYYNLIDEYHKVFKDDPKMVEHIRVTLKNRIRLMVSGSAPMPATIHDKWLKISGHNLLHRYGMTECGMVLSQEYDSERFPGTVGVPLPGVSVRFAEEAAPKQEPKIVLESTNIDGKVVFNKKDPKPSEGNLKGELLVKGDGVFKEYYNLPEATRKEFTEDGWFKTGDICEYDEDVKQFRILGRKSVDIIKMGGYKLSALQIEGKLVLHPDIKECAVFGVEDEKWGQRVAALIVTKPDKEVTLDGIREWAADKMPGYWVPSIIKSVKEIPKNAMGKVNKKQLVKSMD